MTSIAPDISSVTQLLADNYAPLEKRSEWYCDNIYCDGKPHGEWILPHCRPAQRPPDSDWFIWLLMSGRGFGKSRCAAEWLVREANKHPNTEWAVVAPTGFDARKCAEDLTAGIIAIAPKETVVKYNRTLGDIYLSNKAIIHLISADKPDRLRGFNLAGAWCVAEGEKIVTTRGNIPIEEVVVGDKVATRQGWKRVTDSKRTGVNKPVILINTQDGLSLRCTPNHKVFANGVWCDAANLQSGDVLTTWMDYSLMDLPHGGNGKISGGITTSRWGDIEGLPGFSWRKRFGAGITALSRMVTKSIIKMKTRLMTVLKIWNSWIDTNIGSITAQQMGLKGQPLLATQVPWLCGPNDKTKFEFALSAGTTTRLDQPIPAIVENAVEFGHAIVVTVNDSKCSDVYDLTVEDAHEFFANGILVHNCDELSSWRYPDAWHLGLLPTLREKRVDPRVVVTTTPKPVTLLRQLIEEKDPDIVDRGSIVITTGSTFDNADNLAPKFLAEMRARYEGTRRGRQELYGELLTDVDGALISQDMIDGPRVRESTNGKGANVPQDIFLSRIVIAVDPATTSGEESDETGIIVCAKGVDNRGYILADLSCKESPDGWAKIVARAYDQYDADRVVAEKNQGGDMVESVVRSVHPNIAYRGVAAKVGKKLRAEPIAALYEQGKVSHVGYFAELEDQWTTWIPDAAAHQKSPDRVDALVHGLTELGLIGLPGVHIREWFETENPPCHVCSTMSPKGTAKCPKCGTEFAQSEMPSTASEPEAEKFSLTSGMGPSPRQVDPFTAIVTDMLQELNGREQWWKR
jgi:phage terminase large subunit-like protein